MAEHVAFAARRALGPVLLSAAILALAAPGTVLASTPVGTFGGTQSVSEPNPIGQLLGIAMALAGVACAIAIVLALAWLLARIGGPVVAPPSGPDSPEAGRRRSVIGMLMSVFVVADAGVAGLIAGRDVAFQRSVGGLGGLIGEGILISGLIAVVVLLVLVALIATKIRHGHMSQAIATTLSVAGLVAIGAMVGNATAAASGGVYHAPVVLVAAGQANVQLRASVAPFIARDEGRAQCSSVPDGQRVANVTALDLGKLGSGTLRAVLNLSAEPSNATTVEFFIDGADLPDGSIQPSWAGPAQTSELSAGRTSGKLTFSGLLVSEDAAGKSDPQASSSPRFAPGWPPSISGSLTWMCQPWGAAAPPDGSAPPPSVAP